MCNRQPMSVVNVPPLFTRLIGGESSNSSVSMHTRAHSYGTGQAHCAQKRTPHYTPISRGRHYLTDARV